MLTKEQQRLYMLFGYEKHGGKQSVLWNNPMYFIQPGGQSGRMLDEDYDEWKRTKRFFTPEEITQGSWVKHSDQGHSFVVNFLPDGKLIERNLADPIHSWEGSWQLISGVLRMNVGKYELDIIANKLGDIHSGVEFADTQPNAYFKVVHER